MVLCMYVYLYFLLLSRLGNLNKNFKINPEMIIKTKSKIIVYSSCAPSPPAKG